VGVPTTADCVHDVLSQSADQPLKRGQGFFFDWAFQGAWGLGEEGGGGGGGRVQGVHGGSRTPWIFRFVFSELFYKNRFFAYFRKLAVRFGSN
jgi:hypothetical protein